MKSTITYIVCLLAFFAKGQDYPAAEQKWTSHHTLMATGRATGTRSPGIVKKLRKDYSRVVRDEHQIKKYSKQYNRVLDESFKKKKDHSARWILRHKNHQDAIAKS